ncbi:MAG: cytochrome b N-terminal domain-containing protein [Desulfobacterales bacterium]|nr:cytochrome b N-terminal domain-containing protein [Desulfobacterales bacterium]
MAATEQKSKQNMADLLIANLGLEQIVASLSELQIRRDAITWHRFFGALNLVLLVLLFLSGSVMAFYYSPVPGTAYDSVDFALFSLPFGTIIKGIHHYSWNILLVVMGVHLLRSFVVGAYKAPRQMVWISGVVFLVIVPMFIITGDLLPWDQKGYWSTRVRLSIIHSIPFIGDLAVRFLQGGPLTGIVAVTRFYVLHTLFLPGMLVLAMAVHFHFILYRGLSEPLFGEERSVRRISFLPGILNRWLLLFLIVTAVLGLVSQHWTAPLGDPADPTDSAFIPKPEWWVLFLNQLVAIFSGPFAVIGTVVIPGGLFGLLAALPFLDRSAERDPARRISVMIIAAVIMVGMTGLSLMGYIEHFVSTGK